ncbi:Lsr2 family protein [Brachybacterium sp. EF45031]|uniref:histone-like nucleoid-structuring protein Lsr2 n=1 Tax=Brachybacterium sillae TaxID=2810536 RepID=UPI00217D09C9|nr:Lsr2 family protein [Brachybacterium sillae]MCS6712606.1 Lsr2 family protein [Brachybacterium sillae]
MARKTIVELVDDLDGGRADQTVTFSLDGVAYEIDLTDANAERLREALSEWVSKARRVSGSRRRSSGGSSANHSSAEETRRIRAWARENGHEVSDRGRISRELREAYEAAH